MAREYRVTAALYGTGVPVAEPVLLCDDADVLGVPFSVVRFVYGDVVRTEDDLARYDDVGAAALAFSLVDTMVDLHSVSYAEVGLSEFGRPEGFLRRQVSRWTDQWRRVATRPIDDVESLSEALADTAPQESGASVVHGDFRIDNAILDSETGSEVRALVDWEMSTLGDPLADLGLHLVYRDPVFAPVVLGAAASCSSRLPSAGEMAERYAVRSGRHLDHLAFYVALGYFKIAVIAEGIHARYREGETVGEGFETVGEAVTELAAAGRRALASGVGA
jgi:aminoglycoside phosphotransferase (APT) family kinase protein